MSDAGKSRSPWSTRSPVRRVHHADPRRNPQRLPARIAEIAATELNPKVRTEKITALSIALKVLGNLTNGCNSAIEAGELAQRNAD
jgi:hypothetical protein